MDSGSEHGIDRVQVQQLLSALSSPDGLKRQEARMSLVEMGPAATEYLVEALRGPSHRVRWEAAKALGQIGDPEAAPALVEALKDDTFGVRWLAAEGLIRLEEVALRPLLAALVENSDSVWLRQGAHHVLRTLAEGELHDRVAPVVEALEGIDPGVDVTIAATRALEGL